MTTVLPPNGMKYAPAILRVWERSLDYGGLGRDLRVESVDRARVGRCARVHDEVVVAAVGRGVFDHAAEVAVDVRGAEHEVEANVVLDAGDHFLRVLPLQRR